MERKELGLKEIKKLGLYPLENWTVKESFGTRRKTVSVHTVEYDDMTEAKRIPSFEKIMLEYRPDLRGYYVISYLWGEEVGKCRVLNDKEELAREMIGQ